MRGDLPLPAVRMLAAFPVLTHERITGTHTQGSKTPPKIIVNHRTYASVMDASRRLGVHRNTIRGMLKTGKAKYA